LWRGVCVVEVVILEDVDVSGSFRVYVGEVDEEGCAAVVDCEDGVRGRWRRLWKCLWDFYPTVDLFLAVSLDLVHVAVVSEHLSTGRERRSGV